MLKQLFVTAAAAAALSVPLAGPAWAEPSDPSSPDPSAPSSTENGLGKGGMPARIGNFFKDGIKDAAGNGAGDGSPTTPGSVISTQAKVDGINTPDAFRDFEAGLWSNYKLVRPDGTLETITSNPKDWENITPGLAVKTVGPGCGKGNTGLPANTPTQSPGCVP